MDVALYIFHTLNCIQKKVYTLLTYTGSFKSLKTLKYLKTINYSKKYVRSKVVELKNVPNGGKTLIDI